VRVAITGAAGFVGTWLCRDLRAAGHETLGVDLRLGEYVDTQIDLLGRQSVHQWLEKCQPDAVVHLAAQVGRIFGERDVSRTIRWNAEATGLVAHAAASAGVRLVYASTSEAYGDQGDALLDEDALWVLPHNLYGLSKRWGEEVCRFYAPDDLVIVRLSMPYGPGTPPGEGRRAMDTMLWQAHHRMPITVHRGAERSWCWVGDTVRGIRLTLEHPHGGTYNVGRDDDPRTMLEIAQRACKLAGASDTLIHEVDPPTAQTVVKRLATDRIRGLDWEPTVDIDEGMAQVYEWISGYDENGHRP
jgi:nucleoside-diphosphate-sugar epimerase